LKLEIDDRRWNNWWWDWSKLGVIVLRPEGCTGGRVWWGPRTPLFKDWETQETRTNDGAAETKTCLAEDAAYDQTDRTSEAKEVRPFLTILDEETTGCNGITGVVVMALPFGKPETPAAVMVEKGSVYEVGFNDGGTMSAVPATTGIEDGTTKAASGCALPIHWLMPATSMPCKDLPSVISSSSILARFSVNVACISNSFLRLTSSNLVWAASAISVAARETLVAILLAVRDASSAASVASRKA
jgi:hypothetical protein